MGKRQKAIPQKERGSSPKNSLVCRQCGKPVKMIHELLDIAAADRPSYDLCINCFVKTNHYDHRQLPLLF